MFIGISREITRLKEKKRERMRMSFPDSPFSNNFNLDLIAKLHHETEINESENIPEINADILETIEWLCTCPKTTSLRFNPAKITPEVVNQKLKEYFDDQFDDTEEEYVCRQMYLHKEIKDTFIIDKNEKDIIPRPTKEIIVDSDCGSAVLRGANVYVPGVLYMTSSCKKGDRVSVYADVYKRCKKGSKSKEYFDPDKYFVGSGILKVTRQDLFGDKALEKGVAIEIKDTVSGVPQLSMDLFSEGTVLLQNLPSIVCGLVVNPKPGEVILDMCAAPGHKTTHLASLTNNQSKIIAIDKIANKIEKMSSFCKSWEAHSVNCFHADSTILYAEDSIRNPEDGPPYPGETFDRILLDAPCSGLGKRPQFRNDISENMLLSYVPLQKQLFAAAVPLLKKNGVLVYSTCTITLAENEGITAWALRKFPNLQLIKANPYIGDPGLKGTDLTEDQLKKVQRFGPRSKIDSIGFYIAKFVKRDQNVTADMADFVDEPFPNEAMEQVPETKEMSTMTDIDDVIKGENVMYYFQRDKPCFNI